MGDILSPECRAQALDTADYDAFCLIRDAALQVRQRIVVSDDLFSEGYDEDFVAMQASTESEYPVYAPIIHTLRVARKVYEGKGEILLVELREISAGDQQFLEFYNRFYFAVEGHQVYTRTNTKRFPMVYEPANRVLERVTDVGHLWQAYQGGTAVKAALKMQDDASRGDCSLMVNEIEKIFPKQSQQ